MRDATFVTGKLTESFPNSKVPWHCPSVFLVNAAHRRDIMLENEENEVMENGLRKIQVTRQSK